MGLEMPLRGITVVTCKVVLYKSDGAAETVGAIVGAFDGEEEGTSVGSLEGLDEGIVLGAMEGRLDGAAERVGCIVGL
jgi:hypothetical protein